MSVKPSYTCDVCQKPIEDETKIWYARILVAQPHVNKGGRGARGRKLLTVHKKTGYDVCEDCLSKNVFDISITPKE